MGLPITCEPNLVIEIGVPIGTFVGGFLLSWLTLSKKDKLEHNQRLYKNAKELAHEQKKSYEEFTLSLKTYINASDVNIEMFMNIATSGDNYFRCLKTIAEAIMSKSVDNVIRDETLLPMLQEAVDKTLPSYYKTLSSISKKKDFGYSGELKRSNYETIYTVVEKYV